MGAEERHFLIEGAVPADRGNGVVLNLGTATLTPEALLLHIGFRNMGVSAVPTYGRLSESDFHLSDEDSFTKINATGLSSDLRFINSSDDLPPRLANVGTLTFPLPATLQGLNLRSLDLLPSPFN